MRHQTPPARKEHRQPDTGTPERPEIQPPPPPVPPGPDRPPRPGEEPPPEPRTPETIRILPEPRKRAKD